MPPKQKKPKECDRCSAKSHFSDGCRVPVETLLARPGGITSMWKRKATEDEKWAEEESLYHNSDGQRGSLRPRTTDVSAIASSSAEPHLYTGTSTARAGNPAPATSAEAELVMPYKKPAPDPSSKTSSETPNTCDTRRSFDKAKVTELRKSKSATLVDAATSIHEIRPGFASMKTGDTVLTNHFVVQLPKKTLYNYAVGGIPKDIPRKKKRVLMEAFINQCPLLYLNPENFATDYLSIIISWENLAPNAAVGTEIARENVKSYKPGMHGEHEELPLTLNFVRTVQIEGFKSYVNGEASHIRFNYSDVVHALNILMMKSAAENGQASHETFQVGNNKFFLKAGHDDFGQGKVLCAIRGYFSTVKPGMGHALLNVNRGMSAFYKPMKVSEFMQDYDLGSMDMEKVLRGVRVYITYLRGKKTDANDDLASHEINAPRRRIKTIWSLGKPVGEQTFKMKETTLNGVTTKPERILTVQEYHDEEYPDSPIRERSLQAVNCGGEGSRATWFAPEHLKILPFQLFRFPLRDNYVSDMIRLACKKPQENKIAISEEGARALGFKTDAISNVLRESTLKMDERMMAVPVRYAPTPTLQYGGTQIMDKVKWTLTGIRFHTTKNILQNGIHYLIPRPGYISQLNLVHNDFDRQLRTSSVTTTESRCTHTVVNAASADSLRDGFEEASAHKASLVVLISTIPTAYSLFKRIADQKYGLRSLCFLQGNLQNSRRKGNIRDYFGNVAMKVNLKLGNINHAVANPGLQQCLSNDIRVEDTIILGADVTHPTGHSADGTPPLAAVVGSVGPTFGQFLGSMRPQTARVEIIENLKDMVRERLEAWAAKNNGRLPENVLYYRDGVSESQYKDIRVHEIPRILAAYQEIPRNSSQNVVPKVTTIVVSKRHHTRFYPMHPSTGRARSDGTHNCIPGTCVESVVTSPYYFDFYLQSHSGIKGTAKPTHYFVLENGMNFSAQDLQDFTHRLCFTYARSTTSVSYAPPAYYADRLCDRGRHYLKDFFDGRTSWEWSKDKVIAEWNKAWRESGNNGDNPWHRDLNEVMFWM